MVDTSESRMPAPGEVLVVVIDGIDVAVTNIGGTVHAFDDTCTHRSCPLSEGAIDCSGVTCPCHKSRFDLLSGMPLNGPATEPVRIRLVTVEGDRVLIAR